MAQILKVAGKSFVENTNSILDHSINGDITHNSQKRLSFRSNEKVFFNEFEPITSDHDDSFEVITIDIYDVVTHLTMESQETGVSIAVMNNRIDLPVYDFFPGDYNVTVFTASGGNLNRTLEIINPNTSIVFDQHNFEFELERLDAANNPMEENLSATFISTDEIRVSINIIDNNTIHSLEDIQWYSIGETDNDGELNRQNFENNVFVCVPEPINRPNQNGVGRRYPNEPIKYRVFAVILGLRRSFILEQDGKDILRQEYVDFGTNWQPSREEIFEDNGDWNTGNYNSNPGYNVQANTYPFPSGYIACSGNNRFQEIWDQLNENYNNACVNAGIENHGLVVNSSFRNPQRNRAVGSVLINSNHTIGHAMDVSLLGNRTSQRWNLLHNAAEEINGVNAICEIGAIQVSCNNPNISHIHLSW